MTIINCDMGEGIGNDEALMPFIDAANIACGYHAGDVDTMHRTIELCVQHNVAIGAHTSFSDRVNFGRTEIQLPPESIYELIIQQLIIIHEVAHNLGAAVQHVKPHGALYNMSARVPFIAATIANAVKNFDRELILFGLSGSHSISEAKRIGLKTASEAFADRTYQNDNSLTPRSQKGAMIESTEAAVAQVLQMANQGTVTSVHGISIPIEADTICIHGDGVHAVEFAKAIHDAIKK
jgi:5-oxoprolinase (ATP-hydrolysing) subunit A